MRPTDDQLAAILRRLNELNVDALVGIGGNDTADSLQRLADMSVAEGTPVAVIGLPKTIDNDLAITDHSLGYPSAARAVAAFTRDALMDSIATATLYPVKFIEVMGRNAGWLAAAGSLWIPDGLPAPIIAFPECPFDSESALLNVIQTRVDAEGYAVIVVPETMRWADGTHVSGEAPEWVDAFGHPYHASAGQTLLRACGTNLGLRGKLDRFGSVSRSSIDYASPVDLDEATRAGQFAVQMILEGASKRCVVIKRRNSDPYASDMQLAPLDRIANVEARMPQQMINSRERTTTDEFVTYAAPLIGPSTQEYVFIDWTKSPG